MLHNIARKIICFPWRIPIRENVGEGAHLYHTETYIFHSIYFWDTLHLVYALWIVKVRHRHKRVNMFLWWQTPDHFLSSCQVNEPNFMQNTHPKQWETRRKVCWPICERMISMDFLGNCILVLKFVKSCEPYAANVTVTSLNKNSP